MECTQVSMYRSAAQIEVLEKFSPVLFTMKYHETDNINIH